jgi:nucleoside-diphosphate-sugar epimerase
MKDRIADDKVTKLVLITGATGRIGHIVVLDLLRRGYRVRATTSKKLSCANDCSGMLEWRYFNFQEEGDYDELVKGCDSVIHLAAELGKMNLMWRSNVEATMLLGQAAERHHVKAFCYTSSVAVYGSGQQRVITEESPVLTSDNDVRSEYWAMDYVRMYGRTKLLGEHALQKCAQNVHYTILRPAVVVDVPDIIAIRDWSIFKRSLAAHRHAHHIYVHDVSDAIIWSVARIMDGDGMADTVEIFNLSEDEFQQPTHADFMRKAFAATGDKRFKVPVAPWFMDWMHDFLRFRALPLRNPLWRMRFQNDRILSAGYRFRHGMAKAHVEALDHLEAESNSAGGRQSNGSHNQMLVDERGGIQKPLIKGNI